MRTIVAILMLTLMIFSFLMFAHGHRAKGASGYQIWKVPANVSRATFVYRDTKGNIVRQQSADVTPGYTLEVIVK